MSEEKNPNGENEGGSIVPEDLKKGMSLGQRIAVEKLAAAFPEGCLLTLSTGQALVLGATGARITALFSITSSAIGQYLEATAQQQYAAEKMIGQIKPKPGGGDAFGS